MAEAPFTVENFVSLLQKCRHQKNLAHGRCLHAYMIERHLELHSVLGNYLVPMLVDCGSLPDAQHVFDRVVLPNSHAWTSLISGYASNSDPELVFDLYLKMEEQPVIQPNRCMYLALLSACAMLKDVERGRGVHSEIIKRGLEMEHFDGSAKLGNKLVHTYVKFGLLGEARRMLDRLPDRNAVTWATLIEGYAEHGLAEDAGFCYRHMQLEGISPDSVTFLCYLKACSITGALQTGQEIHSETVKRGLELELYLGSTLVDVYAKCGLVAEASHVLHGLPLRNAVSWAALLDGYAKHGHGEEVQKCLQRMQSEDVLLDATTFVCSLKACGSTRALAMGQVIHAETTRRGLEGDDFVGSTLVDMYIKCGLLAEARGVFCKLPVRHAVSWNAIISGYAEQGSPLEVHRLILEMQLKGVAIDAVTFVHVLKGWDMIGAVDAGKEFYFEAIKRGLEDDTNVGSSLVDMYIRSGSLGEARCVFDLMPSQDAPSGAALVAGYLEEGLLDEAHECFGKMRLECMCANAASLAGSLKSCGMLGSIGRGHQLHAETLKRGMDRESFVGNTIVDMYSRCNLLEEAQQVFKELPVVDATSWAALIAGYAEHGLDEEVLKSFHQMQVQGVSSDGITFVCILQSCGIMAAQEIGQVLHAEVAKRGLDGDLYVGSALVDMYGKCKSLEDAQCVFDWLPVQDAVSGVALIAGYVEHGLDEQALRYFWRVYGEGVALDAVTFSCSLRACASSRALGTGQEIHAEVSKRGFDTEFHVGTILVDMYRKCGAFAEAQLVSSGLPIQNTFFCDTLPEGYAGHGLGKGRRNSFHQKQCDGLSISPATFVCSLKTRGIRESLEKGRELHMGVIYRGLEIQPYLGNMLVDMYSKCGAFSEAQKLFDKLPVQSVVSWAALISGYTEHGFDEEAVNCFQKMKMEGILPDSVAFVCALKACGTTRNLGIGYEIHAEACKRGLGNDVFVGSALVVMYTSCGSLADARQVFADGLPFRDAVVWNALMVGLTEHGLDEEVLKCFKQMMLEGRSADAVTYVLCLKACGTTVALETGRDIHAEVRKAGLDRELFVGNMLVDMYGKCGSLEECREAFDQLPVRDVVTWTALLNAYGENHKEDLAVQCFEEMQKNGVKPNAITFTCLLAVCIREGRVEKGQEYFKFMTEREELEPTLGHCACMVDLFARSGFVHEAERFIAAMKLSPSRDILMSFLSACKNYGKVEAGERCFQQLIEMQLEDGSSYVLIADLYAGAGMGSDAHRVEEMRQCIGAKKKPGNAFMEVNGVLHRFVVGVNKREDHPEIFDFVCSRTKNKGYVPSLDWISRHTVENAPFFESVDYCSLVSSVVDKIVSPNFEAV